MPREQTSSDSWPPEGPFRSTAPPASRLAFERDGKRETINLQEYFVRERRFGSRSLVEGLGALAEGFFSASGKAVILFLERRYEGFAHGGQRLHLVSGKHMRRSFSWLPFPSQQLMVLYRLFFLHFCTETRERRERGG